MIPATTAAGQAGAVVRIGRSVCRLLTIAPALQRRTDWKVCNHATAARTTQVETIAIPAQAHARTNQLVTSSPSGSKKKNDGITKKTTTTADASIGAVSRVKRSSCDCV